MKRYLSLLLVVVLSAAILSMSGCNLTPAPDTSESDTEVGMGSGTVTEAGTAAGTEAGTEAGTAAETEAETDDPTEKGYEGRSDFIDQLGGVSDTYAGSVSLESYASAADAANAYVQEEIVGNAEATQLTVVSNGELSEQAIDELAIPSEFSEGIVAVEEMEVSYVIEQSNDSASAPRMQNLSNETRKVTVYVIKYANDWKYFSPVPVKGDTITKSYYDSVFNTEKYQNCTMTSQTKMVIDLKEIYDGQPDSAYMLTNTTLTVKYDNGKILMEQNIEMSMNGETVSQAVSVYMEEIDGTIVCYAQMAGTEQWVETDLATLGFADLQELTPFYDQYLDYTYFTKTNYGFALNNENAKSFVDQTLASDPSMAPMLGYKDMKIDMFAEYYVADGVLSGMREECDFSVNTSYDDLTIIMDMSVDVVTTCTDYGTTSVETPSLG